MQEKKFIKMKEDKKIREKYTRGRKVTILSIFVNVCLIFLKLLAGIFGHSAAIIADALHSASDLITDFACIVGLKYSSKPSDEKHPYGHEKIETLISSMMGIFLIITGVKIGYDGVNSIFHPPLFAPKIFVLVIALISIITKESLYRYTFFVGKKIKSKSLLANAWHHRSDALSSLAAFIGIGGSIIGFKILDPVAAVIIAFFIVKAGVKISFETFEELVDSSVSRELIQQIKEIASLTPGVAGVHNIRARHIGNSVIAEIHVEVDGEISVKRGHSISDEVEKRIIENVKKAQIREVVVHIEPFERREKKES